jgi:hypothetical protein
MDISTVQVIKSAIVSATGLSRDALHIYAGLTAQLVSAAIWRRPLGSIAPWLVVLFLALIVELMDMGNDIVTLGYWRWAGSLNDLFNTVFWPTVLLLYFRFCSPGRKS